MVHSLDLGVVVPGAALSAYWLWNQRPWGYAFTAVLLVKIATLGGAVLAMAVFMIRDGHPVPVAQIGIFAALTLLSTLLLVRFFLAIGPESNRPPVDSTTETKTEA
ncbi:hypothetical protein [Natrinema caseinilyticum]|uniref:hypothetical protein n=1 Tax=Natrinema caseinilyticum TaxID=2961570 RepID=UPI0020C40AE2|nr:hypothetical protein [Natrinema caseinilyticum]